MAYNILSCSGLGRDLLGSCSMAWLGLAITFFVIALVRKWGAEDWGIEFNFWIAITLGLLSNFITITIFGDYRIALIVGLVIGLAAGYGSGFFFGGSGGGNDE